MQVIDGEREATLVLEDAAGNSYVQVAECSVGQAACLDLRRRVSPVTACSLLFACLPAFTHLAGSVRAGP
jgi:hypothetical protein